MCSIMFHFFYILFFFLKERFSFFVFFHIIFSLKFYWFYVAMAIYEYPIILKVDLWRGPLLIIAILTYHFNDRVNIVGYIGFFYYLYSFSYQLLFEDLDYTKFSDIYYTEPWAISLNNDSWKKYKYFRILQWNLLDSLDILTIRFLILALSIFFFLN